jgi:hypothetical protein
MKKQRLLSRKPKLTAVGIIFYYFIIEAFVEKVDTMMSCM